MAKHVKKCNCIIDCNCNTKLFALLEKVLEDFENKKKDDKEMRTFFSPESGSGNRNLPVRTEQDYSTKLVERVSERDSYFFSEHAQKSTKNTNTSKKSSKYEIREDGVIVLTGRSKSRDSKVVLANPQDIGIEYRSSLDSRYHETTITYFLKDAGTAYSDKQRLQIIIFENSSDSTWKIHSQLIKRSGYLNKDDANPVTTPTKLCSFKEINFEIKKILVWHGINPTLCYRKIKDLFFKDFISKKSECINYLVSSNFELLEKKHLSPNSQYSSDSRTHHYDYASNVN